MDGGYERGVWHSLKSEPQEENFFFFGNLRMWIAFPDQWNVKCLIREDIYFLWFKFHSFIPLRTVQEKAILVEIYLMIFLESSACGSLIHIHYACVRAHAHTHTHTLINIHICRMCSCVPIFLILLWNTRFAKVHKM